MDINCADFSSSRLYHLMTQTIIPRPIAWVLSETKTEQYNLAPFSYFAPIASNPPTLLFSVGKKADGALKDTATNLHVGKQCVVHIANVNQESALNQTAEPLVLEESEVERFNIKLTTFENFDLPRVKDCPVALGCTVSEVLHLGNVPQSVIVAEISQMHISDTCVSLDDKGRISVDPFKLNPLARLGAGQFCGIHKN